MQSREYVISKTQIECDCRGHPPVVLDVCPGFPCSQVDGGQLVLALRFKRKADEQVRCRIRREIGKTGGIAEYKKNPEDRIRRRFGLVDGE